MILRDKDGRVSDFELYGGADGRRRVICVDFSCRSHAVIPRKRKRRKSGLGQGQKGAAREYESSDEIFLGLVPIVVEEPHFCT